MHEGKSDLGEQHKGQQKEREGRDDRAGSALLRNGSPSIVPMVV